MKTTEQSSKYGQLEKMALSEILANINKEDAQVATSVQKSLPQIEALTAQVITSLRAGGRLFYLGAGTSGRLGILDASECPPTFGVDDGLVVGLIAGGDSAIRKAVEFAEDDYEQGWKDLESHQINSKDFVIGIAASGSTPYVIGALKACRKWGIHTGCITCNKDSDLASCADFPIEVVVGPEFVTGSTRMKSGTAQKMVLNMISTAAMIQTGRVQGNKMVDMMLSNDKLLDRGQRMISDTLGISMEKAKKLLDIHGSVRKAIDFYQKKL